MHLEVHKLQEHAFENKQNSQILQIILKFTNSTYDIHKIKTQRQHDQHIKSTNSKHDGHKLNILDIRIYMILWTSDLHEQREHQT